MMFAIHLALKAFRQRAYQNVFCAFGLAAVLAPLIVLFGLKTGIIDGLINDMKNSPSILKITLRENNPLTPLELETLKAFPEVGFVVGSYRSTALRAEARRSKTDLEIVNIDLWPSDANDPLLKHANLNLAPTQIALTETVATKLGKVVGDTLIMSANRKGGEEFFEIELEVANILPPHILTRERGLVHKTLAGNLSGFLDNYAIPGNSFGGKSLETRDAPFDSLRIYASSLDMIAPLVKIIEKLGFKTSSEATKIVWIRSLEDTMNGVFLIVSIAGILGYSVSLWATIANSIAERRLEFSLLRLIGLSEKSLWAFPIVQAICITSVGLAIAFAAAFITADFFNSYYLTNLFDGNICRISATHVFLSCALSFMLALFAATHQLFAMKSISPTEALSETI